jgi:hypothetical protein
VASAPASESGRYVKPRPIPVGRGEAGPRNRPQGGLNAAYAHKLRKLTRDAGRDPSEIGLEVWVLPGMGSEKDWRHEIAFWKAAGVTHVTAHTTFNSGHHKRIEGHTAADHLAAITTYRAAVADLL